MNKTNLQGKVAIVTGGGRGIGKAIAYRLAEAGANVVIASRKMDNLQTTAEEFASLPGKTVPMECHIGRVDHIEALVSETEKQLGAVDILVNNGATNLLPVDLFIPGCPPHPLTILDGLLRLLGHLEHDPQDGTASTTSL